MKNDQEKWINDVLGSMQGSTRAQPNPELFSKIENQLSLSEERIIPMYRLRIAAAAAVVLLILNGFTVQYYLKQSNSPAEEVIVGQSLLSNYTLYEEWSS